MTREEAALCMRLYQMQLKGSVSIGIEKDIEAFDMAIRALEQEPILDKIRAEIKEWYWQVDKQALAKDPCVVDAMVDLFIRMIDKYIESEDKFEHQSTCEKCDYDYDPHSGECYDCVKGKEEPYKAESEDKE